MDPSDRHAGISSSGLPELARSRAWNAGERHVRAEAIHWIHLEFRRHRDSVNVSSEAGHLRDATREPAPDDSGTAPHGKRAEAIETEIEGSRAVRSRARAPSALGQFLRPEVAQKKTELLGREPKIDYLDYDWSLNGK